MYFGHSASLHKTLLIVFNMASISFGVENRQFHFYPVEETGNEEELGMRYKVPSSIACARLCSTYRDPSTTTSCVGIQFDEHNLSCRLLSGNVNWTPSTSSKGNPIYRKDTLLQGADGFQMVNVSGYEIRLAYFNTDVIYSDARSSCLDMGGYLLHLDTDSKFQAAVAVAAARDKAPWVGVYEDGVDNWVYELNDQPLTPEAESHWLAGGPNNPNTIDCAAIKRFWGDTWFMDDYPCSNQHGYICEFR